MIHIKTASPDSQYQNGNSKACSLFPVFSLPEHRKQAAPQKGKRDCHNHQKTIRKLNTVHYLLQSLGEFTDRIPREDIQAHKHRQNPCYRRNPHFRICFKILHPFSRDSLYTEIQKAEKHHCQRKPHAVSPDVLHPRDIHIRRPPSPGEKPEKLCQIQSQDLNRISGIKYIQARMQRIVQKRNQEP